MAAPRRERRRHAVVVALRHPHAELAAVARGGDCVRLDRRLLERFARALDPRVREQPGLPLRRRGRLHRHDELRGRLLLDPLLVLAAHRRAEIGALLLAEVVGGGDAARLGSCHGWHCAARLRRAARRARRARAAQQGRAVHDGAISARRSAMPPTLLLILALATASAGLATPAPTTATATPTTASARTASRARLDLRDRHRLHRLRPSNRNCVLAVVGADRGRRRVGRTPRLGGALRGRVAVRVAAGLLALTAMEWARYLYRFSRAFRVVQHEWLHRDGARRLRRVGEREGGGDEDALRVARRRLALIADQSSLHGIVFRALLLTAGILSLRADLGAFARAAGANGPALFHALRVVALGAGPSASRRLRSPGSGISSSAA